MLAPHENEHSLARNPVARDRQQYRVEIDAGAGDVEQQPTYSERAAGDTPFRIAVLGDFSGRSNRGMVEAGRAIASRRPMRVDRDNVDDLLGRFAPQLQITVGDTRTTIHFSELEDFHPDRIYVRLPAFRALRETRERAAAPTALRELGRSGGRAAGRAAPTSGNLLDQILGDVPAPPGGAAASPAAGEQRQAMQADPLTDFVRRAVAPHVVPQTAAADPERVGEVDTLVADDLRGVLHDAAFQQLESAWRSVDFLVRRLETDVSLQVHLIDVAKAELATDLGGGDDVAATGTYRLLVDTTAGAAPWALLVGLYSFGPDEEDVALLSRVASIAAATGAPFIANADSRLVGSTSFASAPDPDDWDLAPSPAWTALRRSEVARYIGLTTPRFLLRLPYGGPDGEPCEVPAFRELSSADPHEEYLWGSSAVLAALLHAEAFVAEGWVLRPRLDVLGLPFHLVRAGGEVAAKPCAEAVLTARAVDRILDSGVMAVQSHKDADAIRFARMQSVAEPLAALALRHGTARADG